MRGFHPRIYPQGSFALGTAVRPIGRDDYDVDAVCLLNADASAMTQPQLKAIVGRRLLHPTSRYKDMIDPPGGGRRCWTIKYADASRFHLDVLPAIPDEFSWLIALGVPERLAKTAIRITDRRTWNSEPRWPRSNPQGYVEWFKDRMRLQFDRQKQILAMERRADVQDIQDYEIRTPLQRVVQLLKRHRDVHHAGDENKPISIIITTLVAAAYDNETDVLEAILSSVPRMRKSIEKRGDVWWVPNPVNPNENFADRWAEDPRKADVFFEWLDAVERHHRQLLSTRDSKGATETVANTYGQRVGEDALTTDANLTVGQSASVAPAVVVPRREGPPERAHTKVEVSKPSKPWKP